MTWSTNNLGLRLSGTAVSTRYIATQQSGIPFEYYALTGGGGIGATARLSYFTVAADAAYSWSRQIFMQQYKISAGLPIVVNSSWEFRTRVGYRHTNIDINNDLGGGSRTVNGLDCELEFAMPLRSWINLFVTTHGTVSQGFELSNIQPGFTLGFEFLIAGNTPYHKNADSDEIALMKAKEIIGQIKQEFTLGTQLDITQLSIQIKKLADSKFTELKTSECRSLANYALSHTNNDAVKKEAEDIIHLAQKLPNALALQLAKTMTQYNTSNVKCPIVRQYITLVEELIKSHPETAEMLSETLSNMKCIEEKP